MEKIENADRISTTNFRAFRGRVGESLPSDFPEWSASSLDPEKNSKNDNMGFSTMYIIFRNMFSKLFQYNTI